MRPKKRIKIFLKILKKHWLKQGQDLRFFQFLYNNGVDGVNPLYHLEENEIIHKMFPEEPKRNYVLWGTRGKNGDQPLKYKLLKDLTNSHIKAILRTQPQLSSKDRTIFKDELDYRKLKKC